MAANISLFPVITDDLLGKTRFQASPYQLYYVRDDQEYVLLDEYALLEQHYAKW